MVGAVGVGARCGLSMFRGPKGDWSVVFMSVLEGPSAELPVQMPGVSVPRQGNHLVERPPPG